MKSAFSKISLVLIALAMGAFASVDQCKPIGWATRSGRTGDAFEVTGGGNIVPITVKTFDELQKYAKDSSPRVIYIDGTLGNGWNGKTGDRLNITGSNKTIIGLKPGTVLKAPIHISKASNIIVRNIVIQGPGSNADQAWDNLTIENDGSKNIWIDHCEFWDGQDGNADVVKGADNVTFTWCIFGYKKKSTHNLSNLIGSSDNESESVGKLNVTYMFNWWQAANQRKPRCRYGQVHVVNNLITGNAAITAGTDVLGVAPGIQCVIRAERNHFIDEHDPFYLGLEKSGIVEAIDNKFTSCSGNQRGNGSSFTPPYEYSSFMLDVDDVEAAIRANAGANLESPTVCDANYVEPPPPTPDRAYQVDKGSVNNAFIESDNGGFHGDAYVNFDKGGDVSVPVEVDVAGEYKLDIDYANGSGEARSLVISVGEFSMTAEFKATSSWGTWETYTANVDLMAGANTLNFATLEGKDGPNLDQFDVSLVKPFESAADSTKKDSSRVSLDSVNIKQDTVALDTSRAFFAKRYLANAKVRVRSNKVYLEGFGFLTTSAQFKLYAVNGKTVLEESGKASFDLSSVSAGLYLMKVVASGFSYSAFITIR